MLPESDVEPGPEVEPESDVEPDPDVEPESPSDEEVESATAVIEVAETLPVESAVCGPGDVAGVAAVVPPVDEPPEVATSSFVPHATNNDTNASDRGTSIKPMAGA